MNHMFSVNNLPIINKQHFQSVHIYLLTLVFNLILTSPVIAVQKLDNEYFNKALTGKHRASSNVKRDHYRHPKETLLFLGLKPDMTVIEIWPSQGWYTEILAPLLRDQGILYSAGFAMTADRTPQWRKRAQKAFMEKLEQRPDIYDHVVITELSVPERTTIAPPASADLVLTFRNIHNWMAGEYAKEMFEVFYRALKPQGLLGVVEHRAKPGTSLAQMIKSGYVTEDYAIQLATAAGFKLEAKSEINANPKDTKNYLPRGVWSLPPNLERCRKMDASPQQKLCFDQYNTIGESDRMTLRFRKP